MHPPSRVALLSSLPVTKAILLAQFLRARAWWRLDSAGASALPVARSVVSLLDAAGYARALPDDDPAIAALDAAGAAGIFNLLMGTEVAPRRDFIVGGAGELDPSRIDT